MFPSGGTFILFLGLELETKKNKERRNVFNLFLVRLQERKDSFDPAVGTLNVFPLFS